MPKLNTQNCTLYIPQYRRKNSPVSVKYYNRCTQKKIGSFFLPHGVYIFIRLNCSPKTSAFNFIWCAALITLLGRERQVTQVYMFYRIQISITYVYPRRKSFFRNVGLLHKRLTSLINQLFFECHTLSKRCRCHMNCSLCQRNIDM